ncbi:MAG TPA: YidC/Oxa1 family membrane protein insertase [Acidimicrobiia bacterium]|nr:YidC/Oxa1 family membrane protein insertase [Acidimicrobiia bacterium]
MDPLYKFFGWLLAVFYAAIPNLGVAIILLTIGVMLILFPLTAKQAKSMLAMQRVQPEIKRLQAKYKNDRQKLNEEMMKFYKENQINPLAGCLPLVVQLPVFFALYRALRSPYKYVPVDSKLFEAFCHPTHSVAGCKALPGGPHHLKFLGMDLSQTATHVTGGFVHALPYYILIALIIFTGYLQSRQTTRNQPAGGNPQMAMVGKIMPVFFGVISLEFPAGLNLYFFISNLWRVGQQELIMRKIAHPSKLPPVKTSIPEDEVIEVEAGTSRTKPGSFLERLLNPTAPANGKSDGKTGGKASAGPGGNGKGAAGPPKPAAAKAQGARPAQGQQRKRNKKRRR